MKSNRIEIKLEVDASMLLLQGENTEELGKTLLFFTAVSMYKKGKLSLGKAVQLCCMERLEFISRMKGEVIAIFDYETQLVDEMIAEANGESGP
jgi:predicted HTH domain antitoxin